MPGVMMMWITKQVLQWIEKWGTWQTEQPLIPEHSGYSPMLKSLQDLSITFEAMVTKEVVDDASLWVDGGTQHHQSASLSLHHLLDPSDPLHQYCTFQKPHHKIATNGAEESGNSWFSLEYLPRFPLEARSIDPPATDVGK
jgi:hypothetical protein